MSGSWWRRVVCVFGLLLVPNASFALFHVSQLHEIMTSYNGNAAVQFVEIRMLAASQNQVAHSVLAAFDTNGNYVADVLEVPSNVTNQGIDVRWLMGTSQFQTASGITPDFIIPATLPTPGGMLCWGGGGGILPQNPPTWSRTNFANYVDCIAYGGYTGPTNVHIGTPTSLKPVGHSLQRTSSTNNNSADFACGSAAHPTNNAGTVGTMPATTPCTVASSVPTAPVWTLVLLTVALVTAGTVILGRRPGWLAARAMTR